ncbi:MAG TPA: hypothetical protein VJT09_08210, partial [Pyrinomonadaceae bacterium]|nr:hypothetical protein [Pyrinomonadaceae bacterium]
MTPAIKISLLASGLFLLTGMLTGVLKYQRIMASPEHRAPVYVDIAHRAAFLYSFALLVIAKLLEYSPYPMRVQVGALAAILVFFVITILGYIAHGVRNDTENIFARRTFTTTWYMYLL